MGTSVSRVLAECPLTSWSHRPGHCNWCDRMLVGRQTRWCSTLCQRRFAGEHEWTKAREAAKRRDGNKCTRCGSGPHDVLAAFQNVLRHLGVEDEEPEILIAYRQTDWFKRIVIDRSLEVNHISPRWGRGYGLGCHNHLTNLATLCHRCHVETTNAQRATGGLALLPPLEPEN